MGALGDHAARFFDAAFDFAAFLDDGRLTGGPKWPRYRCLNSGVTG
jgi:hypothetical protein